MLNLTNCVYIYVCIDLYIYQAIENSYIKCTTHVNISLIEKMPICLK